MVRIRKKHKLSKIYTYIHTHTHTIYILQFPGGNNTVYKIVILEVHTICTLVVLILLFVDEAPGLGNML